MSKKLIGCGVVALSICVAGGSAQAKLIRYEIDGKRYSYSTNNIQQTREARRRIEAANAAAAAKTRAEAELASNPIVRIFGSRAQREAATARVQLEQSVSARVAPQDNADLESTSSVKRSRAEPRRSKQRVEARVERRRALREARLDRRRKVASARAQRRASLKVATTRADLRKTDVRKEDARPVEARNRMEPTPNVPVVERAHAVVDQPSRDTSPRNGSAESAGSSLMDFVNQVRKALP